MSLAATLDAVTTFVAENPEAAQVVPRADGELVGPLEVRVAVADHQVTVDEPEAIGGANAAPSPVETALVSLASCQAITYRLWAIKLGVDIDRVSVAVEADYDARGLLGVDGYDRPGFTAVRVIVTVEGAEGEPLEQLRSAVDEHCPVLDLSGRTWRWPPPWRRRALHDWGDLRGARGNDGP
ncbi:MAG: OsmC family protein [Acidimicrobiales bacterium]